MPVTLVLKIPLLLVVNPKVPAQSVKELIDYMKLNPGKLNFSSIGNGTTMQLAGELFKSMAGVDMVHVPYKGSGPSVLSVVTGETSLTFDSVFLTMPQVKAGKLRALAATTTKPSIFAPELPTVSDSGLPGFDVESWLGFLAPAGTPKDVVQKLQQEIARILQLPEMRERLLSIGLEPIGSTTEFFADYIKSETNKWGKVVKQAGIKLD